MARPWIWNGHVLKTPSEYPWLFSDLSSEETGRALDGKAYKDIVAQKRSFELVWWSVKDQGDEMTTVQFMSWVKSGVWGTLSFPDPTSATNISKIFYTGDVSCTMYQMKNDVAEYKLSVSFVQQ